jgi:hypothetical protein
LLGTVEGDVVGDGEEGGEFVVFEGGGIDVVFAAKVVVAEEGFVEAAGGGAGEVTADEGKFAELGEGFQGEEYLAAGGVHHGTEGAAVALEQPAVEEVAGRGEGGEIVVGEGVVHGSER